MKRLRDDDAEVDADVDAREASVRLTPAQLSDYCRGNAVIATKVILKNLNLTNIDAVGACRSCRHLDLLSNRITSAALVSSCIANCVDLVNCNLSRNRLTSITGLPPSLQVLNVSHNEIASLAGVCGLLTGPSPVVNGKTILGKASGTVLLALVANNNKISSWVSLDAPLLNTLVLSSNLLNEITGGLGHLPSLRKLSISHNQLRVLPKLSGCRELIELRVNSNKINTIPASHLDRNQKLKVLDMGNNRIQSLSALGDLSPLKELRNLNLVGNPITELEGYRDAILTMIPLLEILDGKPLETKKKKRKFHLHKGPSRQSEAHRHGKAIDDDLKLPPTVEQSTGNVRNSDSKKYCVDNILSSPQPVSQGSGRVADEVSNSDGRDNPPSVNVINQKSKILSEKFKKLQEKSKNVKGKGNVSENKSINQSRLVVIEKTKPIEKQSAISFSPSEIPRKKMKNAASSPVQPPSPMNANTFVSPPAALSTGVMRVEVMKSAPKTNDSVTELLIKKQSSTWGAGNVARW